MKLLKQSTAATVVVGPVLDANGAAVTTAVVGDFRIAKNGTTATLSGATVTHDANGYYTVALTTGNTDTVGRLAIYSGNTAHSMATHHWTVLLASVFDAVMTNATNSTGGFATATGSITALAGAISTYAGGDTTGTTTLLTRLPSAISLSGGAVTVGTNNDKTGYSLTPTTGLGNQTANITGSVSSVTARVTANTDQWGGVTVTGMPMPTYTQPTGFLAATFPATVSSYAGGAVASVSGSVGSIAGVTFPTHFNDLEITANGHVSAVVQSIANNSITASSIQGGAITAAKFAADAITASALAADAVAEIQAGLATAANLLIVSDRVSYSLTILAGACSDAQTAAETYTLTIGGNTFTVDYTGLDSSGNRSTTTLSKT
jgi:hypothetical protein